MRTDIQPGNFVLVDRYTYEIDSTCDEDGNFDCLNADGEYYSFNLTEVTEVTCILNVEAK